MRAQLLAVAIRAAALKVPHHRKIDAGRVKPKRLQAPIEQIGCRFVPPGKTTKVGNRDSQLVRYVSQLRRVAGAELICCCSSIPNSFTELGKSM
jgi:hypothetical protein